jgi:hypothetical protein
MAQSYSRTAGVPFPSILISVPVLSALQFWRVSVVRKSSFRRQLENPESIFSHFLPCPDGNVRVDHHRLMVGNIVNNSDILLLEEPFCANRAVYHHRLMVRYVSFNDTTLFDRRRIFFNLNSKLLKVRVIKRDSSISYMIISQLSLQ